MRTRTRSRAALGALLADSRATFLPRGGTLGFALRHAYPPPQVWTRRSDTDTGVDEGEGGEGEVAENPLDSVRARLAGSDAALFAACTALGLRPRLRLVCRGPERGDGKGIVLDHMEDLGGGVESAEDALLGRGGVRVRSCSCTVAGPADPWSSCSWAAGGHGREEDGLSVVHWIMEASDEDGPRSAYATYGDEAALCWLRTSLCVLVEIGPFDDRSKQEKRTGGEEVLGNDEGEDVDEDPESEGTADGEKCEER